MELAGDFRQRILHLQQLLGHKLTSGMLFEVVPGLFEMFTSLSEALEMPAPCRHRAFRWRLVAERGLQMVAQCVDTLAFERGDVDGTVGNRASGVAGQVDLVSDDRVAELGRQFRR